MPAARRSLALTVLAGMTSTVDISISIWTLADYSVAASLVHADTARRTVAKDALPTARPRPNAVNSPRRATRNAP